MHNRTQRTRQGERMEEKREEWVRPTYFPPLNQPHLQRRVRITSQREGTTSRHTYMERVGDVNSQRPNFPAHTFVRDGYGTTSFFDVLRFSEAAGSATELRVSNVLIAL